MDSVCAVCGPTRDWSLSVESSRKVVTPKGNIGATVANAANGIEWPADVPLFGSFCEEKIEFNWVAR